MNPLAPARTAANKWASEVEGGEDEHPGPRRLNQLTGGLDTVQRGSARPLRTTAGRSGGSGDGILAVLGFSDHFKVRLALQDEPEARANQRLVVASQDPDHTMAFRHRMRAWTRQPGRPAGTGLHASPRPATRRTFPPTRAARAAT